MKTFEKDTKYIDKFVQALSRATDCLLYVKVRVEYEGLKPDKEILYEIDRARDFLIDAEKDLKLYLNHIKSFVKEEPKSLEVKHTGKEKGIKEIKNLFSKNK